MGIRLSVAATLTALLTAATLTTAAAQPAATNNPTDYKLLAPAGITWDSCRTISYRINLNGVPTAERRRLHNAFNKIEDVTNLEFRYTGTTTVIPLRANDDTIDDRDPRANITLAFAKPGRRANQAPLFLNSITAGYAVAIWETQPRTNTTGYTTGMALFNTEATLESNPNTRLHLYMHELGHIIGLGHVNNRRQIMHPTISNQTTWGVGDRTGLRRLGSGHRPCPTR